MRRNNMIPNLNFAHVAQLVEHILGKDEVTSSNLVMGSTKNLFISKYNELTNKK